ncbi:hypothetical protein SAY87_013668 [Trapa incisa]|uniref:Uncharacterized protein n=1 Tax=Trapa incisa TaxID=236973 RepID=A0AAN7KJU9_9MYRT|nr:hypothetical protein SAY87_013668 [Trapa incisa]
MATGNFVLAWCWLCDATWNAGWISESSHGWLGKCIGASTRWTPLHGAALGTSDWFWDL